MVACQIERHLLDAITGRVGMKKYIAAIIYFVGTPKNTLKILFILAVRKISGLFKRLIILLMVQLIQTCCMLHYSPHDAH